MNIRKYSVIIVSGAIALVLAAAALFFMFLFAGRFQKTAGNLAALRSRLDELNKRNPYPDERNVDLAGRSLTNLNLFGGRMLNDLLRDQYEPPAMEPAQFPLLLQARLGDLVQAADASRVVIADRFFGFERYARSLPVKDDIPRLARQIHYVNETCRLLFASQVRDLASIERHVFEEEPGRLPGEAAAAGMPPPELMRRGSETPGATGSAEAAAGYREDPVGLYVRERMYFTFSGKEKAIWDVLNALPKSRRVFCIVAEIDLSNETSKPQRVFLQGGATALPGLPGMPPVLPPGITALPPSSVPPMAVGAGVTGEGGTVGEGVAGVALGPGEPTFSLPTVTMIGTNQVIKMPPHEKRVVAGRNEVIKVRLGIDFYHFKRIEAAAETQWQVVPANATETPVATNAVDSAGVTNAADSAGSTNAPSPAAPANSTEATEAKEKQP